MAHPSFASSANENRIGLLWPRPLSASPDFRCWHEPDHHRCPLCFRSWGISGSGLNGRFWSRMPSRPGEFHPEPLTDPDLNLSIHPARAIDRRLPPSVELQAPPVTSWPDSSSMT